MAKSTVIVMKTMNAKEAKNVVMTAVATPVYHKHWNQVSGHLM